MLPLIKFSEFEFNQEQGTISYCDDQIHLEYQQSKLLALLIKHHGTHVTREQIANDIWQGIIVEDNTISKAITRLRKVLNDNAKSPKFIKTVPKKGYQFIADFEQITSSSETNVIDDNTPFLKLKQCDESSFETTGNKNTQQKKKNSTYWPVFCYAIMFLSAFFLFSFIGDDETLQPIKRQPSPITYKQGLERNAHLSPDNNELLFTGNTDNGYGIFHQTLSSTAKLLTTVNSPLSAAKWIQNDKLIYSILNSDGQCSILLAAINTPTNKTQLSTCDSKYPVELFVDQKTNQIMWQDLSGAWQLNLNDHKQELLPFDTMGSIYSMPSPNRRFWAKLTEIDEKSVLSVFDFDNQQLKYKVTLPYLITHFKWSFESDALYHLSEHPAQQLLKHSLDGEQQVLVNTSVGSISQISDVQAQESLEFIISSTDLDIFQLSDGNEIPLIDSPFPDYNPVMSPLSNEVAFASKRTSSAQIWLKHSDGNYSQLSDFPRASYIYEIVWSNNADRLLVKRNKSLYIINIKAKKSTKLNIDAEDKIKWQWINPHSVSYIDSQTRSLFAYDIESEHLNLIKSNVGSAQLLNGGWFISDASNQVLTRYDENFNNPEVLFDQIKNRSWLMNDKILYLFNKNNEAPDTLVKVNNDGSETIVFSRKSINPLTINSDNKGSFVYHKVSSNEANVYQLKLKQRN